MFMVSRDVIDIFIICIVGGCRGSSDVLDFIIDVLVQYFYQIGCFLPARLIVSYGI